MSVELVEFLLDLIPPGLVSRIVRVRHIWSQDVVIAPKLLFEGCNQFCAAFWMMLIASAMNEKNLLCCRTFHLLPPVNTFLSSHTRLRYGVLCHAEQF